LAATRWQQQQQLTNSAAITQHFHVFNQHTAKLGTFRYTQNKAHCTMKYCTLLFKQNTPKVRNVTNMHRNHTQYPHSHQLSTETNSTSTMLFSSFRERKPSTSLPLRFLPPFTLCPLLTARQPMRNLDVTLRVSHSVCILSGGDRVICGGRKSPGAISS